MERIDEVKFGMDYADSQGVTYDRAFPPAAGATYQVNPEEAPEEEPDPEDPPSS
jgi:hypothetical protein